MCYNFLLVRDKPLGAPHLWNSFISHRRQCSVYIIHLIPLLQMAWRCYEPGYQKQSYWPSLSGIFQFQNLIDSCLFADKVIIFQNRDILITYQLKLLAFEQFITQLALFSSNHYNDVIMSPIASQITSLTIVYSTVYSDADQRKHQSSRHWPLWGEFTGDRWIPRTNGQ